MKKIIRAVVFLCALVALMRPAAADEPAADAHKGDAPADAPDKEDRRPHGPIKMSLGVHLTGLHKLDLALGTFQAEFILSVRCDKEPCKGNIGVSNGKVTGKDKLHDDKLHKIYKMKADLAGDVDLSEYPFDAHILPIVFEDDDDPEQSILEVDKSHSKIEDEIKLAGWHIDGWESAIDTDEIGDGKKLTQLVYGVEVSRPRLAAIFKSILPALMMVLVAGMSLFLRSKSAPARLAASTGALLTIVAFHISSTSSLPPLGYLTRMDKFMTANYLIYLVNILFCVLMLRAEDAKDEARGARLYALAWKVVPVLTVLAYGLVFSRGV
ncbi:Hypothetical protein A7982_11512 [Minicystis rosea]|nr:Hypothetical protein A7982_11512 [Minicystis rosea]